MPIVETVLSWSCVSRLAGVQRCAGGCCAGLDDLISLGHCKPLWNIVHSLAWHLGKDAGNPGR